MQKWGVIIAMFVALNLPWYIESMEAKTGGLARISGAALLTGYPPYSLALTSGDATSQLQTGGGDWYVAPSMSADGHLIASAHTTTNAVSAPHSRPRLIIGTYSTNDGKWTYYKELAVFDGSISISPDGTKLACITRRVAGGVSHLSVLDLKTGKVTAASESTVNAAFGITWSPDSRRIAFEREFPNQRSGLLQPLRAIFILNVETGVTFNLTGGESPSWSPSGKWIAFYGAPFRNHDVKQGLYDKDIDSLNLIHPDGTDYKTLSTFHSGVSRVAPVWSPDSRTLLINKWRDEDRATMDIYMIDLTTRKLTKKFGNTPPVFAWVAAK